MSSERFSVGFAPAACLRVRELPLRDEPLAPVVCRRSGESKNASKSSAELPPQSARGAQRGA
eukprot:2982703-Prymnesium_polylepis.1